jgi:hypothetical protein
MPDEIIHVEVMEVGEEPRPKGYLWRAVWTAVFVVAVFLAVKWWPSLMIVLIAAAILAALSTAKVARRRALWEARFGRHSEPVGAATYIRFLAAWFFGITIAIPLAMLVVGGIILAVVIIFVVALLAVIASLFSAE